VTIRRAAVIALDATVRFRVPAVGGRPMGGQVWTSRLTTGSVQVSSKTGEVQADGLDSCSGGRSAVFPRTARCCFCRAWGCWFATFPITRTRETARDRIWHLAACRSRQSLSATPPQVHPADCRASEAALLGADGRRAQARRMGRRAPPEGLRGRPASQPRGVPLPSRPVIARCSRLSEAMQESTDLQAEVPRRPQDVPRCRRDVLQDVPRRGLRRAAAAVIVWSMSATSPWTQSEDRPLAPVRADARKFTRDEVMTAGEVAHLLHMPVSALARRGQLPALPPGPHLATPVPPTGGTPPLMTTAAKRDQAPSARTLDPGIENDASRARLDDRSDH
jgi:hypothetical protein